MIRRYSMRDKKSRAFRRLLLRSQNELEEVKVAVRAIIQEVRAEGDSALVRYAQKFDDAAFQKSMLCVDAQEIEKAYENILPEVLSAIREQIRYAQRFHERQRSAIQDWEGTTGEGIVVGEKWTAIEAVGLYIPGGKNPFPTVAQILAVPAVLAGSGRIVAAISPKGNQYETLVALAECGVTEIYRMSGAQAIAALAYGTSTVKPVELIAGPGSPWVTAAKILCQERVAIDMPAGPSEAVIIADGGLSKGVDLQKKAEYCAADILARAEHGPDSAAVLVTTSGKLARLTQEEIKKQFELLSRKEYLQSALKNYCGILLVDTLDEAVEFTNSYAPEHLEILTENPRLVLEQITNAGSVFLGMYNPVALGDYASGVNHILPASGWAKRTSAVGVWTFMKRVQYSDVSKMGLRKLQPIVNRIADVEGLDAHRASVDRRLK